MTYVIGEPCVDVLDRACVEECPVDCIYEGERMLYIHPDECVDCGACEPVCPVEAIYYEDDLPEQMAGVRRGEREVLRRAAARPRRAARLAGRCRQARRRRRRHSVRRRPAATGIDAGQASAVRGYRPSDSTDAANLEEVVMT